MDAVESANRMIDVLEARGMGRVQAAFKVAWWSGFYSAWPYLVRFALWKRCTNVIGYMVGSEMLRFHEWERRN